MKKDYFIEWNLKVGCIHERRFDYETHSVETQDNVVIIKDFNGTKILIVPIEKLNYCEVIEKEKKE